MAVLNPEHLFEQADRLIAAPSAGPPRQVDIRRAISSAYYGIFHFILARTADEFIGASKRSTKNYALAYRSVDHRSLYELCGEVSKTTLKPKYRMYEPTNGFGSNIAAFADAVRELQDKRHAADYDPTARFKTEDAKLALMTARSAIRRFERANEARKRAFLSLLAFPPR